MCKYSLVIQSSPIYSCNQLVTLIEWHILVIKRARSSTSRDPLKSLCPIWGTKKERKKDFPSRGYASNVINCSVIPAQPNTLTEHVARKIKVRSTWASTLSQGDTLLVFAVTFHLTSLCYMRFLCFYIHLIFPQLHLLLIASRSFWQEPPTPPPPKFLKNKTSQANGLISICLEQVVPISGTCRRLSAEIMAALKDSNR